MTEIIIWAVIVRLPQASLFVSDMQQTAPRLRVHYPTEAKNMLKELKYLSPMILFRKINAPIEQLEVWNFSDAPFNISSARDYGQTGIIIRIHCSD